MRSTTTAQDAALAANVRGEFVQIEVQNADGTWIDLTDLAGFDWVMRWSVAWGVDQPIPEARVSLARDRSDANRSLAPLRSDSPLNVDDGAAYAPLLDGGRGFRINAAVMAWGATPGPSDWVRIFTGEIDEVEWGQDPVQVIARSAIGVQLADRSIETETVYGSDSGVAMQTVIQSILTDWTDDPVSIYTPSAPGFNIVSTPFQGISVLDAINRVTALIGWVAREEWHDGTSQFRLTLRDPDRSKTTPDHTIGPEDYWDVESLRIGREDVRNAIRVTFVDSATGEVDFVTAEDATSIARYGRKPLLITEGAGSSIDTEAEAQAMADAALADLKDPVATQRVDNRFFWPAQLGDLYTFTANGVHYNVDQDLAVTRIEHHGESGTCGTRLSVRGTPIGFNRYWRKGRPSTVDLDLSVVIPSTKLVPKPDTTQDGIYYIELQYNVGADVDRLHIQLELDANGGAGLETADYRLTRAGDTWGTLVDAGRHRIGSVANPQQYLLTDTDVKITVVPESADGITGTPVVLDIGRIDELGTGTSAALSAGGYAVSDYLVPGSNVTIDKDGNGRPRINATGGGGGASALDDLSDVTITSPADGEALFYDTGDWVNRDIAAGDVRSGVFGLARGGIGRSSVTAGNLIVGAGTSAMTELAPGAAGGFVRSNGSSWVRSAIQATDIPSLPASIIGSGTFDDARIPNLNASKITAGTFDPALISQSSVTQHQGALAIAASQVTSGTFADARIPSLSPSKITGGGTFGAGNYAFAGTVTSGAGEPGYYWSETDADFQEKRWRIVASAGSLFFQGREDDGETFANPNFVVFRRNGVTATGVEIYAPLTLSTPLAVASGGTGWTAYVEGSLLVGNGSGGLDRLPPGSSGQVLAISGGVPTWVTNAAVTAGDVGSGEFVGTFSFNNSVITPGVTIEHGAMGDPSAGRTALYSTGDNLFFRASTFAIRTILHSASSLPAANVSGTLATGNIPSLDASKITSGTFNIARIPSIPVSGLTPGTLANGSWVWRGADGSAAAPSRSFNSDTNTGDYRVGENIIGIATAGVQRGQWDTTGLKLVSGSAAAPSLANIGFTNYGMYWASGVVGLSVAGTSRIRATTSGAAVTGTITATGDVQSSVSDARLKTELRPIDRALDRVDRLHGVTHRYTDEALDRWPELTASRRAALIAQDVADVLPEAVVPFAGDDVYLNYMPDMVIPLLVEAIKELRGEVEALRMGRAA